MSDDDRKDFATIQLELKKKNSKVDYLPWHKEKRSWEQLGVSFYRKYKFSGDCKKLMVKLVF